MRRPCGLFALAACAVLSAFQGSAQAQYGQPGISPYNRPTVSPYLNLLRPGLPATNYYNLVVPQQQFSSNLNMLQQQVTANQGNIAALGAQDPLTAILLSLTGHQVSFMNYRRYFLNFNPMNPLTLTGAGSGGYGGYGGGYGGYGGSGGGFGRGLGGGGYGITGGTTSPFGTPGGLGTGGRAGGGTGFRPGGIR